MWHLVGKASWGWSRDSLAWWSWFGGVVGWCSSWCSAAATGEPLDGSSNHLHGAEQKVSFKGAVRNSLAFSVTVCACSSPCMMSGVGSVLLGLVYRIVVNISFPFAPCRKSFQFFDFASCMAL